nr:putative integron gene cassette protein [uncultured bacterium]
MTIFHWSSYSMKKSHTLKSLLLTCSVLLTTPSLACASDFGGFILFQFGLLAAVFAVAFMLTWVITNLISNYWIKVSVRTVVILLFWTPVPSGGNGDWLPLPLALL